MTAPPLPDLPPSPGKPRRPASWSPPLVASAVTAGVAVGLIGLGRIYDSLPFHPPPCSLKRLTGIPCVGCGGTRAVQALSKGDLSAALAFNPLVTAALLGAIGWFVTAWIRHRWGPPLRPRTAPPLPLPWMVGGVLLLLASNWIYLIFHLPR